MPKPQKTDCHPKHLWKSSDQCSSRKQIINSPKCVVYLDTSHGAEIYNIEYPYQKATITNTVVLQTSNNKMLNIWHTSTLKKHLEQEEANIFQQMKLGHTENDDGASNM